MPGWSTARELAELSPVHRSLVAATLLGQPVLKALHRLAQEEESVRRYGLE